MSETTNLYLLIFPASRMLKVGKADDIHNRIQALRRYWGEVDYAASYYFRAPLSVVLRLERSLHFFLEKFSQSFTEGDGKTELFSIEALDLALKHIELYSASTPELEGVKQGVPQPVPSTSQKNRRRRRRDQLLRRSNIMTKSIEKLARQFGRMNRLLAVLYRKQSRIPFEYDVVDGVVYFRLLRPAADVGHDRLRDNVMDYFSFQIEDLNGWTSQNRCTVIGMGDVIQYTVRMSSVDDRSWTPLIEYFSKQTKIFLERLPKRSAAAVLPIPILDEAQVWAGILGRDDDSEAQFAG